jgi:signal transduction histidine kinase
MVDKNGVRFRLKEATHITGVSWVALLERNAGKWQFLSTYRLTGTRKSALEAYIAQDSVDSWLCGALGSRSSRSRQVPGAVEPELDCVRLFAYPIQGTASVIFVGGKEQKAAAHRVWKLVASTLVKEETEEPEVSPVVSNTLVPAIQEGVPFDLPDALDRMLALVAQQVPCQGAWLAIRRGDVLEIQSHWRAPQSKGVTLGIESNALLLEISKTRQAIRKERGKPGWASVPKTGIKSTTGAWGCVPLVVGQRLIGVVCLWRLRPFSNQEWKQFVETVVRSAPSVEVVITFTELGGHLRRLAMLNDFVWTVSSVQSLLQISKRVFALLSRAFQTEDLSLFLLSTDERTVREYRNEKGKVGSTIESLIGHHLADAFREGAIRHLNRESGSGVSFRSKTNLGMIIVPLKYRGRVNGLLVMESSRVDSFSVYDVHLITVIAGHLAGLVEYSRLREEAESRARNLGLIHEVVQEVIGLVDKQEVVQITAELLVQYFGYEFVIILLVDDQKKPTLCGVGGSRAPSVKNILNEFAGQISEKNGGGITAHVLSSGESLLVNDVSESVLYKSIRGWDAGSELCLALKDGNKVIGLIDIESGSKNAFGQNDFMALESLAGILSNVLSNADQYQRLQETVRQLRQIQQELQTRIEAQLEAEQKLIQAEKLAAVGEMAAGIAHELNNPLTTVTGFTELVIDGLPVGAEGRSDLELVLREAMRARDVVRRLLDFSRRSESERTRVDLNELISDVLSLINHLRQTQDVALEVNLSKELPWVSVDRNQIKQVLLNLFHNSLQAMPNGGKLIIQTGKRQRDGRKWVLATVEDTGDGISDEYKARIFEPFFTTRSDQGGTGLGLSVSYSIITNHGGVIEVDSQKGKGTKFSMWLPY